jgi:serine/threonine protein kinase
VDNESESISAGDTPINITVADTNPRGAKLGPAPCVAGYEILGVLDRGGMAVVYKARQLSLNRIVALKMIRGGEHAGPKELERFRAETQAVACLRHPHIVQVFEAGESNGMLYCAMELVAGGSLARKLNGVPVSSEPAARLTAKLARALDVAHQANIVHRDLKPANVLLEPAEHGDALELRSDGGRPQRYEPKVADFGLACWELLATWHLNRRLVITLRLAPRPTSTRSVRCSTKCSLAARPFEGPRRWRRSVRWSAMSLFRRAACNPMCRVIWRPSA